MKTEVIKSKIHKLSVSQRKELIDYIKGSYSIFHEYSKVEKCPFCDSVHIIKNGTRKDGTHKHICKDCGKNFTYKSKTVISNIQKLNTWNEFVEDFISLNITSLKDLAIRLKISKQTAFNWRIKLLSAISIKSEMIFNNEEVEFDESFFLISRKGRYNLGITNKLDYKRWRRNQVGESPYNVKLFFTYGRGSKQLEITESHMGRTSRKNLESYFIENKFNNITIYTDSHPTYRSFFKDNENINQEIFLGKNHISIKNNKVHNQTTNAYINNFKNFVNKHMKGVSTKYLSFYAKWFEFIISSKRKINKIKKIKFNIVDDICNNVLSDNFGLEVYRQSEYSFNLFLKQNGRTNYGDCKNHYYAA